MGSRGIVGGNNKRVRALINGNEEQIFVANDRLGTYTHWHGEKIRLTWRDVDNCWVVYTQGYNHNLGRY